MQDSTAPPTLDLFTENDPAIGPCCYKIGPEAIEAISTSHRLFTPSSNSAEAYLNLWEANAQQLRDASVHQIEVAEFCMACSNSIFLTGAIKAGQSGSARLSSWTSDSE